MSKVLPLVLWFEMLGARGENIRIWESLGILGKYYGTDNQLAH